MSPDEFRREFKRLCDGWRFEPTHEQMSAFSQRLGLAHHADWHRAVDTVLANWLQPPRSGLLDILTKAVDDEVCHRRKLTAAKERAAVGKAYGARLGEKYDSEEEYAYARFRHGLLIGGMGRGRHALASFHAEGLAGWLDASANAIWARDQIVDGCGPHDGRHSLLSCLTAELAHWIGASRRSLSDEQDGG